MKQFILIVFLTFSLVSCKSQVKIDSTSLESRMLADKIFKNFDSISPKSKKILYSLDNKDFYVIINLQNNYQEYYVFFDNNKKNMKSRVLTTDEKEKNILIKSFDLDKYHTNFITKMPNANYVRGKNSYFVIKDKKGKRYGEYCLSSLTLPLPIDSELAGYLIRKLSQEITKNRETTKLIDDIKTRK